MKVLNKAHLVLTCKGMHAGDGLYSKFDGENYELADMHAQGVGYLPQRNFMEKAKNKLKNDKRARAKCAEFLKMSISSKMKMSASVKAEGGVWIDWDNYGEWVAGQIHSWLMEGSLRMKPLKKETIEKKRRYGYGPTPLYASGELAKSIGWTVVE